MIQSQNIEDMDQFGNIMEESFAYPELLLKTDLLNDSSSDNQSDDHSIHLSIQGISLQNDSVGNQSQGSPQFNQSNVSNFVNKRPQTGYKKRLNRKKSMHYKYSINKLILLISLQNLYSDFKNSFVIFNSFSHLILIEIMEN